MKKLIRILLLLFAFSVFGVVNAQRYLRKTNLPHVFVNTYDGMAITSKDVYVYASLSYVDETDSVTVYDSVQIRGRGNSTWKMQKKPYRIKFNKKQKFLGKGYANAKSWTFLANAGDKSLMRNAITSLMGDFTGLRNNPAHKFVDLTLNGTYVGTYQISDHIEVRPHRVNITEQDYPLADDSNITGGYLLEIDGFHDGNCFSTTKGVYVRIHYPDEDEIAFSQKNYIRNYVNTFEKALYASDFDDAEKGYRQYVDSASLVNWFLVTEITANIDGYYSAYFYKNQDDPLLYWGPVWDYDIAYNNDSRILDTQTKLMDESGYGDAKKWVGRMWEDPWFGQLVNRRFKELTDAGLEDYMYAQIDSISALLGASQEANYKKWGINRKMYHEIVLYSSYDQYVSDVKKFIKSHLVYLSSAFAQKRHLSPTPAFVAGDYWYRISSAKNGNSVDYSGTDACCWSSTGSRESQLWKAVSVGDYYVFVNKESGMALSDPTQGECTETTNVGAHLSMANPDLDDERQYWSVVPQGTEGYYNLVNAFTRHTINLSGGSNANGAAILSYTTDYRNSESLNRLWYIKGEEKIEPDNEEEPDNIECAEPEEYVLAYNPTDKVLHFGSETPDLLTFRTELYSSGGMLVRSFRAADGCTVADLPSGVYIVRWSAGGKNRSVKLKL